MAIPKLLNTNTTNMMYEIENFFNDKGKHVEPRAVIFCDTLQKEIDILMDNKTFSKISVGDTISVNLDVKYIILDE